MPVNRDVLLNGRYLIVSLLGEGAMGAVYRAMDTLPDPPQPVAVKEFRLGSLPTESQVKAVKKEDKGDTAVHEDLPAGVAVPTEESKVSALKKSSTFTREKAAEQFKKEAKLLFSLDHPNLPKVSDYFEVGDDRYLVMELIEGEDLEQKLEKNGNKPMLVPQALDWVLQVAGALGYCHSKGTTHRDVKPSNIIVTGSGKAYLVDFGIARMADSGTTTMVRGKTRGFSPIEQYSSRSKIDARSDVYALGATLYTLLGGQAPEDAMERAVGAKLVPLRELNPLVSEDLEGVVLQAMDMKQENRFQSMSAFVGAIRNALPFDPSRHAPTEPMSAAGAAQVAGQSAPLPVRPVKQPIRKGRLPGWALGLIIGLGSLVMVGALLALGSMFRSGGLFNIATMTPLPSATPRPSPTPTPVPVISAQNADTIRQLQQWGKGSINSMAYAPDGSSMAIGTTLGIYLYDPVTFEQLDFIQLDYPVYGVTYSPDGATIAAGTNYGYIYIWKPGQGNLITLVGHEDTVWGVAFSPDEQTLISGSYDATIRTWDVTTGQELNVFSFNADTEAVLTVAYSSAGNRIAAAFEDNTIKLIDPVTGNILQSYTDFSDYTWALAFSPDGKYLAAACGDGQFIVWDAISGTRVISMGDDPAGYVSLAFSHAGDTIAVGSYGGNFQVWDWRNGSLLNDYFGHDDYVTNIAFSTDDSMVLTASPDKTVRLWDLQTGVTERTISTFSVPYYGLDYSPVGDRLAVGDDYGNVFFLDAETLEVVNTLQGHYGGVLSTAFSRDGRRLVTTSRDQTAIVWDANSGAQLLTLEGHTDWVREAVFSPNGQQIASASDDGTVRVWDATTGNLLDTFTGHTDYVLSVAISPDGQTLASGGADYAVYLWDVRTASELYILEGHSDWVRDVTFSPDGRLLASVSDDHTVRIWDVDSGTLLDTYAIDGSDWLYTVDYSPDGSLLAIGTDEGSLIILNASNGLELLRTVINSLQIMHIQISPDGTTIATTSTDGTVRLWGLP